MLLIVIVDIQQCKKYKSLSKNRYFVKKKGKNTHTYTHKSTYKRDIVDGYTDLKCYGFNYYGKQKSDLTYKQFCWVLFTLYIYIENMEDYHACCYHSVDKGAQVKKN